MFTVKGFDKLLLGLDHVHFPGIKKIIENLAELESSNPERLEEILANAIVLGEMIFGIAITEYINSIPDNYIKHITSMRQFVSITDNERYGKVIELYFDGNHFTYFGKDSEETTECFISRQPAEGQELELEYVMNGIDITDPVIMQELRSVFDSASIKTDQNTVE